MTQINTNLIPAINSSLDLQLAASLTYEQLHEKLSSEINNLINHDFEKLIFYLYRIVVELPIHGSKNMIPNSRAYAITIMFVFIMM